MIYPKSLNKNDRIGVIATSKGISKETEKLKFYKAIENFEKQGHNIIVENNINKNYKARSSTGEERTNEFIKLWKDDNVKAIITLKGGSFLIEKLPFLEQNKEIINLNKPKWVQVFSDTTILL